MPTTKTAADLSEILKSDPFYSPDTNLDLSAFPHLQPLADDSQTDDDVRMVKENSYRLRDELSKMIEQNPNDPEIARMLKEAGIENPALPTTVYIAEKPFIIAYKEGLWRGEGVLNRLRHRLTAKSREELLGKLGALARKAKRETVQELTEGQLTEVARAAQRDRVQAIHLYLSYALPEGYAENNDPEEIVNDPRLAAFLSQVCEFVWLNSRLDATDSQDWRDFAAEFVGNRPVSCALLDNAWAAFTDRRNRLVFVPPPAAQEAAPSEAPERFDDLDDSDIEKMMNSTKREFVRQVRAGTR